KTNHPLTDLVIIRENEEDLYAGIEHQQTNEVVQCLKLISSTGSEKIIRYAFEYAKAYGRKKVTCMTKDNIMKHADGLFHKIFKKVAQEYPEITADHLIIDIGSALIANRPHTLDVVVTLNLYGDIISDIAAEVTGSVGLGGSANIGNTVAMFEAIHGSAPDIAGKDIANPSGLINAAIMMLVHIGQSEVAAKINNAWLTTLEDGIHTGDIYNKDSLRKVGTSEFAREVILRMGKSPTTLKPASFKAGSSALPTITVHPEPKAKKELVGVDVFLDWDEAGRNPKVLGDALAKIRSGSLKLAMISNRGVLVYPESMPETHCADHWRCRYKSENDQPVTHQHVIDLLGMVQKAGFDFIKTEHLYTFNGERGYSLGQGE
ncbi:MAG: NADP-dependent isocitrate dehydrogenase, partial [Cyclobacteriaceae bacterium]